MKLSNFKTSNNIFQWEVLPAPHLRSVLGILYIMLSNFKWFKIFRSVSIFIIFSFRYLLCETAHWNIQINSTVKVEYFWYRVKVCLMATTTTLRQGSFVRFSVDLWISILYAFCFHEIEHDIDDRVTQLQVFFYWGCVGYSFVRYPAGRIFD